MNNLKEKQLNNKGFSLVELIIVIAIMAVLVGILAPQYLKYVERSRAASDRDNIDAIVSALQVYAADPEVKSSKALGGGKLTLSRTADISSTATNSDEALSNAGLDSSTRLSNTSTFTTCEITVTVNKDKVSVVAEEK